jgi:hypothetical protein
MDNIINFSNSKNNELLFFEKISRVKIEFSSY